MKRVIDKFNLSKANLIIDGNFKLNYKNYSEQSVIKGDQLSISIATASIIAKIHRDRLMTILSKKFTQFTWNKNAGYGTKQHLKELISNGPTIYHRKSFEPIKSLIHNK
jgi:ribonuclease HII